MFGIVGAVEHCHPAVSACEDTCGASIHPGRRLAHGAGGVTAAAARTERCRGELPCDSPRGTFPTSLELRHMPARGIVVTLSAWSSTRGFDLRAHPIRALPLRFSDSKLRRRFGAVPTTARWYLLGARVHGHIVEVNIFVNRHTPAAAVRGLIQSELDRIVIPTR
jgi:hypothetical protein